MNTFPDQHSDPFPESASADADVPSARALFEVLVREHSGPLLAFIRAIARERSVEDDLMQEAFVVAWRRIGDYDRSRPFGPWLRGIAARCAMKRRRSQSTLFVDEATLDGITQHVNAFESRADLEHVERIDAVRDCVDRLAEEHRTIVQLAYQDSRGLRVIAEFLAVTEENAKKRLQRARAAVAKCMESKGLLA
ncbi:MAG: sigma-70 family RNA polymerase sigma factor [Phycisphaerales bacterium]|nr:sigma-70 family RNA polymerase sigma factor [Phycisphaerales bacterium]